MSKELDKRYDAKATEARIGTKWEEEGFFNPDNLPERHDKPFVVMLPPPNVTGSLHMGHALENSLTDCLVRMKRMQGFKTLWLPGTDHAGIATQRVVEKKLKKNGQTRFDIGKEKFLEMIWAWKEEYGDRIFQQLKRIGASLDYSRTRFTMDDKYAKTVETAFNHYKAKGLIYKGERIINWCYRCGTSLSDLELEYEEKKDFLYYIKYPFADDDNGGIVVATTRPETMLGDTAVAVHPDDKRWRNAVRRELKLPLTDRTIPVIADDAIEIEFGTGAVKVTPAHSFDDAEIGERHNLPTIQAIGERGRMTENVPKEYQGLRVKAAREKIVEDLEAAGFLEKTEPIAHNVANCYRCNTAVEPLLSTQWFMKMSELAKSASDAYSSRKVGIKPERWVKVALDRLAVEHDWCISRQLWWGHKIPVDGEEDVLDTWFSSALWPFATLGWPEKTDDLKKFYPTQWMTSARDILFLWINRMVFSGLEFMGEAPFQEVFIHPTVLTKDGKRMSKSLGTGIDPLKLIDQHGADATRFGLLWQTTGVQDIRFDESAILAGKKFTNKVWNATRYVLGIVGEEAKVPTKRPDENTDEDKEILNALNEAIKTLTDNIERLRFGQALEGFYEFFWHTFCDVYIEQSKLRNDDAAKTVLLWVLSESLKALHPFIPFVTDALWERLPHEKNAQIPIVVAEWPKANA